MLVVCCWRKIKLLEKNCLYICFADSNIGVGHLFRGQILAKSLKKYGWTNFLFGPKYNSKKEYKKIVQEYSLFKINR